MHNYTKVSLFTTTIAHLRAEFFYNSREVFENHFFLNFSQESPRGTYTAFSIPNLFDSFDHICTSVSCCYREVHGLLVQVDYNIVRPKRSL